MYSILLLFTHVVLLKYNLCDALASSTIWNSKQDNQITVMNDDSVQTGKLHL